MEKLAGMNVFTEVSWVYIHTHTHPSGSIQSLRLMIPNCYIKSYTKLKKKIKVYFILKPVNLVLIGTCMQGL